MKKTGGPLKSTPVEPTHRILQPVCTQFSAHRYKKSSTKYTVIGVRSKGNIMKSDELMNDEESPIVVPCPKWLQKRIRRNLVKASLNKLDKSCDDKASEILKSLGSAETKGDAQQNIPDKSPQLPVRQTAMQTRPAQHRGSKLWVRVTCAVKNYAVRIFSLNNLRKCRRAG